MTKTSVSGTDAARVYKDYRELLAKPQNTAFTACESTFTSLLGRMAIDAKREVTWEEMMRS